MTTFKWRVVWLVLSLAAFLSGCEASDSLAGLGKGLEDFFKNIKLPSF